MGKLQGRIERDFTVIHNDFIRDERLGLDELGMLLKLMSLPEDWDFSIAGLAKIVANGKHKVTSALNKLKKYGYFRRIREVDPKTGRVIDWIYEFSDQPHPEWITSDEEIDDTPDTEVEEPEQTKEETPQSVFPDMAEPHLENEPQLNTYKLSTYKSNMIDRCDAAEIQKSVEKQIRPDIITQEYGASTEQVDEIVAIITDVYMADDNSTVKIDGNAIHIKRVKELFTKLTPEHIDYVLDNLKKKKSHINNIKGYLITSLYNSVLTYDNHTFANVHTKINKGEI